MSTDLILIADGNTGRGQRVANALEAAGHICRVVPHGAAGLEVALSEKPTVVVAQADLPLVDAGKLAEIMRANPRTRSARFLFLGRDSRRGREVGNVGDAFLDAKVEVDGIIDAVETLIDRQLRIEGLEARAQKDDHFQGKLSDLQPAEILQMLHSRGATGRLTLTTELHDGHSPAGHILIVGGEIHSAETGPARGEKALFRVLDWRCGDFDFEPSAAEGAREIRTPTRSVLAEGLRQLDEWNRLAPTLPPLESPVNLKLERSELPTMVHPLTQEVLELVEDATRVADVIDGCAHPDYQVLRTLHTLEDRGIVEFGRARIVPPDALSHALFNEAQGRRLRAFAQARSGTDTYAPSAKLLIVAGTAGGARQFADLLAKVPGAELTPCFERGRVGERDLEAMARIDVDGEFAIDLIHLPSDAGHAALWPLAAHGALGTIFLLDASVGSSAAGIAQVSETLTQAPGSRTFHVVMLTDGERLSPDELRGNLSLIDDASLFLLPIEPGKDPSSLLRSLFARIVP